MKFKSLMAVSMLLFSSKITESDVQAFRFPQDLSLEEKKIFIAKVDRFEKRFDSSKITRDTVKTINKIKSKSSLEEEEKKVRHGPIVQEHSNNFDGNSGSSGGLIRNSIYARYFNLQFEYQDAQDLVAGFSYQVFNDLFLYNAEDCTFWSFDTFSDMINSFLLLVEDNKPDESILSFGYSVHKGPVAYYTCTPLVDDYLMIVTFYNEITQTPDKWGTLIVRIFWNFFFNWADLYYEFRSFENEFEKRDWTKTGTSLAKMFTDLCFKSPINEAWNTKNSDVINVEWGEPPNFLQGINDIWVSVFGQESFLSEEQMQRDEDRIKDASDLDLDDPEPQNINIFDDDKKKQEEKKQDNNQDNADDKKDSSDDKNGSDIVINIENDKPEVQSDKPKVQSTMDDSHNDFKNLLLKQIRDSQDAPIAHYMLAQMQANEPEEISRRTEKVQRLARCVARKGAKNQELKKQATAIMKILNHLKNQQSYLRVEPLLDFTLGQYHCV